MNIDTTFLRRCIASLERAVEGIEVQADRDDLMYDIYRVACVKEFELVLGQSGKLLRKRLAFWFASNRQADRLHFKDLFRHAARHDLMECGWLNDGCATGTTATIRRTTTERTSEATLQLLPAFIRDARALAAMIERPNDA